MIRWLMIFAALVFCCSCTRVGEYYTDVKDFDIEDIIINNDRNVKYLAFGANIIGEDFNGIVFVKIIDTANSKGFQLKRIVLQVNNLSDSVADKSLLCIDKVDPINFNQVEDIPELGKKVYSGLPLEFIFKLKRNAIRNLDLISISLSFYVIEDGEEKILSKDFKMRRHNRYKSKLVNS